MKRSIHELVEAYTSVILSGNHREIAAFCTEGMLTTHHMGTSSLEEFSAIRDRLINGFGMTLILMKQVVAQDAVTLIWEEQAWIPRNLARKSETAPDHVGLLIELLDYQDGQFCRRWLVRDMQFYATQIGW